MCTQIIGLPYTISIVNNQDWYFHYYYYYWKNETRVTRIGSFKFPYCTPLQERRRKAPEPMPIYLEAEMDTN